MTYPATAPAHGERDQRVPLTVEQDFLCMWDKGDDMGPFGPRFHIVDGWRVSGPVDVAALRMALADVVAQHEVLRTAVVRGPGERYQEILEPSPPRLDILDLGDGDGDGTSRSRAERAEELLNDIAADTISVREMPLLRAVLGRFDADDAVLALIAHHTAVDAWSMQILMRDLTACYAARSAGRAPDLPAAVQYQDYARWQEEQFGSGASGRSRGYWREKLHGASTLTFPTDRLRSAEPEFSTSWYRFSYGAELSAATTELAAALRCSPFMVLLAAFKLYVAGVRGATDVVVPTFTPGRAEVRFQETVGSFYNCLPLRTDLAGCATFRDVVARTRATCLEAYTRELPFAHVLQEAPEFMAPAAVDGLANCVFQVIQTPHMMERERVGDLEFSAIRTKVLSQTVGSDIPDGTLLCLELDRTGELIGEMGFSSNLYDAATIRTLIAEFREVLHAALTAPDAPLAL
ncbi:condensation domain-containing protein [Streptomyces sp. Da 82-17]|uniref:condensation domain-containing protein n=1 Tax=Streptomyces sp. Da 82-17 TaxID=3377116 RepID=UPI0038D3E68D